MLVNLWSTLMAIANNILKVAIHLAIVLNKV